MTLDIAKFHRTCPILPDHKPWIVVQGSRGYFIDHACPFRCSSASSNAGMISNAAVDIWEAQGVYPIMKYEDDLCVFRFPTIGPTLPNETHVFAYDRLSTLHLIEEPNIPWHPDKGQNFNETFKYIGFLWNIAARTVSLPEEKRLKFLNCTRYFISAFQAQRCVVKDVMKIHGSLCHIAYIYPEGYIFLLPLFNILISNLGRNHLASLSNFIVSFTNKFERHFTLKPVINDLQWWNDTLLQQGRCRHIVHLKTVEPNIFVDTSTSWGIGIWFDGKWDAWKLADNWRGPCCDIGWLEGIALKFVIYILASLNFSNTRIIIHSDNKGVIGAFDKGRCRNFKINLSICRSLTVLASQNVIPNIVHVESKANLADPISRGILGPLDLRLGMKFDMPDELMQFFLHV